MLFERIVACPQVSDMVEAALREADIDHDGSIGLADFEALMRSASAEDLDLFATGLPEDLLE